VVKSKLKATLLQGTVLPTAKKQATSTLAWDGKNLPLLPASAPMIMVTSKWAVKVRKNT
jgi:hypothetical protein